MLQATRVFKDEIARQNYMYWLSGYCFQRSLATLQSIASCGHPGTDPHVNQIWPTLVEGESRCITMPMSKLTTTLDNVKSTILTNGILHICSAFEAVLEGYYLIGLLYRPDLGTTTRTHQPVPKVLATSTLWKSALEAAIAEVSNDPTRLKGKYSKRVTLLCTKFGLAQPPGTGQLDDYYSSRHTIAHDQSLPKSSDATMSYLEIIKSRLILNETDWKEMLATFLEIAEGIESELLAKIVTDSGLAIAVLKECERTGEQKIGELRQALGVRWGIDTSYSKLERAAKSVGRYVSSEKRVCNRRVR
jgi:hypothetical protein